MKNKKVDYLLIGDSICNLICIATNTLWITFILSLGMNVYQFVQTGLTAIALVSVTIIVKRSKLIDWGYKHYKQFLIIEGLSSIVAGVLTLLTGSVWSVVIICFVMKPFGSLQRMNNNRLMRESYTPSEREHHDNLVEAVGQYVQLTGLGLGFLFNLIMTPAVGTAVSFFAEVINNFFYWRQYEVAQARKDEERDAA